MGYWLGCPVQRSDRSSPRPNHSGVFPVLFSAASCIHVFVVEVAGHQDRESLAELDRQIFSDQYAGRPVSQNGIFLF
jgi:hypothetical protein